MPPLLGVINYPDGTRDVRRLRARFDLIRPRYDDVRYTAAADLRYTIVYDVLSVDLFTGVQNGELAGRRPYRKPPYLSLRLPLYYVSISIIHVQL